MKKVKFTTINNVTNFCNAASTVDGEVIVTTGRYTVDGKSILGILSLTLNNFVEVYVKDSTPEKENNFWEQIALMGIETKDA